MPTASWLAMAAVVMMQPIQAPFRTTLPWSLPEGTWEIAAGVTREAGSHPPFFTGEPEFERDLWRASLLDLAYGAGPRSEVRIQAGWQRFHEDGGETAAGVDDVRLSFMHRVSPEPIAVALIASVKLPNASDGRRLGTDEADIFLGASAGWRSARWGVAGEAGLGILGNPRETAAQDDVALLGLAGWRFVGNDRPFGMVTLEASGLAASRLGNDARRAAAGLTLLRPRIPVSIVAARGLTRVSEDWSVTVRVTVVHPFNRE